jgi:hypothetical protein
MMGRLLSSATVDIFWNAEDDESHVSITRSCSIIHLSIVDGTICILWSYFIAISCRLSQ